MSQDPHDANDIYHVTPHSTYVKVYAVLLVMTVLTVVLALPAFHIALVSALIAVVIATFKASLVVWFFMHQNHENRLNRAIFVSGFFFLILLFGFTFTDWSTRGKSFRENNKFNKIEEPVKPPPVQPG